MGNYLADDQDSGDSISWSLAGTDAGDFAIENGILSFRENPDFESPADSGRNNVYNVVVRVSDGKNRDGQTDTRIDATLAVTVTVSNEDEAGTLTLTSNQPQVDAALTATLTDPDGGITALNWQWQVNDNGAWSNIAERHLRALHPRRRRRGQAAAGDSLLQRPPGFRQDGNRGAAERRADRPGSQHPARVRHHQHQPQRRREHSRQPGHRRAGGRRRQRSSHLHPHGHRRLFLRHQLEHRPTAHPCCPRLRTEELLRRGRDRYRLLRRLRHHLGHDQRDRSQRAAVLPREPPQQHAQRRREHARGPQHRPALDRHGRGQQATP